ncbi:hypothetical protein HOY80DRAFT_1004344 [Tuber brumale]|nr:hypothetical protein HOY80DRAFT_1004344 [Tuber brumale]
MSSGHQIRQSSQAFLLPVRRLNPTEDRYIAFPELHSGNRYEERERYGEIPFLSADEQVSKVSAKMPANQELISESPEIYEKPPPSTTESQKPTEPLSPHSEPLATRLIKCCLRALRADHGPTQFRHLGRFRLWADEYDTPHGQLDKILEKSPILEEATITLLADLCNILTTRTPHPDDTLRKERISVLRDACAMYLGISQLFPDGDSECGGEEDEIETIVDSLFNLSPLLVDILENPLGDNPTGTGDDETTAAAEVAQRFDGLARTLLYFILALFSSVV